MRELKERFFEVVRESKGSNGLSFEIVIIREGKSKNGTYYPKETLLKSRELFEGAKVAFYEWNGVWDHLSEDQKEKAPAGFPNQTAGVVTDIRFKRLDGGKYGLVGELTLTESNRWLAEIFALGLEKRNKDVLGFSIDVLGDCAQESVDGEKVDVVKEIGVVNEITVVTNPAAGGRLERMVASVQKNKQEGRAMKDVLFQLIAALRPKKLYGVSITEAEEPKVKELAIEAAEETKVEAGEELKTLLDELIAAVGAGETEKVVALAKKIIELESAEPVAEAEEEVKADAPKAEETKEEEEVKKPEANAGVDELKTKQEATDKRLAESEKRICESTLRAALAESKLPEAAKDRIKERFTGKTFEEAELSKEIAAEVKYCSKLAESLHPNGLHVEVGETSVDKLGDAIEGMIKGEDINKVPRFVSIHEAFSKTEKISPFAPGFKDRLWIGMVNATKGWNERRAMKEAIATASFPQILGDRLHKQMVSEYNEAGLDDWKKIVSINPSVKDFLTNRVTRLGGYGTNMPVVAEAAAYTALTSPTDEEATYAVTKKGGLETISMEAIRNDNLRALQLIPKRLARGCKNTLYQFVFDFIADNAAIYDGDTYFHAANHANLGTTALSWAEFNVIATAMMDQAAYNEANFFPDNKPKYIIVPNELWVTATEIARSQVSISAGRTETVDNSYSTFDLEPIRVPYWTDVNNYAVMADPKKIPTIELAFLDGNEEPELLQEAANTGVDFTNDQIRYKVRHIYGGAVVEYRSAYKGVVA